MLVDIQEMLAGRIPNLVICLMYGESYFIQTIISYLLTPIATGRDSRGFPCVDEVVVYEHFIEIRWRCRLLYCMIFIFVY